MTTGMNLDEMAQRIAGDMLTPEEEAEILAAQALIFRVTNSAASRWLEKDLPAARQRVTDAEQAAEKARQEWEPAQAVVDKLTGELEECQRRAGNVDHVIDEEADLAARIEARSLVEAFRQEAEHLRKRIGMAQQVSAPLVAANGEAARELATAEAKVAELEQAARTPFFTDLGAGTPQWAVYQLRTGFWLHSLKSATSRGIIMHALRESGIGEEIERRAIKAFTEGDPAALAAGTTSKRWDDGTTIIVPESGPPVVSSRASAEQVRNLPPAPRVDATHADVLVAAAWHGIEHNRAPGLPGFGHELQPQYPPSGGITK